MIDKKDYHNYSDAIYSGYFPNIFLKQIDGNDNIYYYGEVLEIWFNGRNKQVENNPLLKDRYKLLKSYNRNLYIFAEKILDLFKLIREYDDTIRGQQNSINFTYYDITLKLQHIQDFSQIINHNINTGHYRLALHVQHYCVLMFKDILSIIDSEFFISLLKSPLKNDINKTIDILENSINLEKLKLMSSIKNDDSMITDSTSNNDYEDNYTYIPQHVKKLINTRFYKSRKDLSFLYYALKHTHIINLTHAEYKAFLNANGFEFKEMDTRESNAHLSGEKYSRVLEKLKEFEQDIESNQNGRL